VAGQTDNADVVAEVLPTELRADAEVARELCGVGGTRGVWVSRRSKERYAGNAGICTIACVHEECLRAARKLW
jgi:hypothetical protein